MTEYLSNRLNIVFWMSERFLIHTRHRYEDFSDVQRHVRIDHCHDNNKQVSGQLCWFCGEK